MSPVTFLNDIGYISLKVEKYSKKICYAFFYESVKRNTY